MTNLELFEKHIETVIKENYVVDEAMNYSLLAKSKRLRPVLLLNLLEDLNVDPTLGLSAASSLEMIHTYSLIHDDLPAFDNDDYRRGKLTCHKAFDEATAILAGDGLLTKAFENVVDDKSYNPLVKVKLVKALSDYAGHNGMIKGQSFDMALENSKASYDQLAEMELLKTGKLLTVPFLMALIIADKEEYSDLFIKVGKTLGLAFQIQDDILDITSNPEVMGKSLSDSQNEKSTFVTLLGLENAKNKVCEMFEELYSLLGNDYPRTLELIRKMENRTW